MVGFGTMFPPAIEEIHPLNHERPANPLGFVDVALNKVPYRVEQAICPICGLEYPKVIGIFVETDNTRVCPSCYREKMICCDTCGEVTIHLRMAHMRDGRRGLMCRRCIDAHYERCDGCNTWVHESTMDTVNNMRMCPSCDEKYRIENHKCRICGAWVPVTHTMMSPTGARVCIPCGIKASSPALPELRIGGYHKTSGNVLLSTVGSQNRHYGIEWEGENGKLPSEQDATLWQALHAWIKMAEPKEDGSVRRGMEWATKPMDLKFHREFFGWEGFFDIVERHGFKAHESLNAGLHISVSNLSFKKSQTRGMAAFTFLWNNPVWRTEIQKFSRRRNKYIREAIASRTISDDPWGYCSFYPDNMFAPRYVPTSLPASRRKDYSIVEGLKDCILHNKTDRNSNVNFWDYDYARSRKVRKPACIEVRIFKSTNIKETLIAAIELCDVFVDISTSKWTEATLRALTWEDVCRAVPSTHTALKHYLSAQKLWRTS
jgi:hypothetical protein